MQDIASDDGLRRLSSAGDGYIYRAVGEATYDATARQVLRRRPGDGGTLAPGPQARQPEAVRNLRAVAAGRESGAAPGRRRADCPERRSAGTLEGVGKAARRPVCRTQDDERAAARITLRLTSRTNGLPLYPVRLRLPCQNPVFGRRPRI